MLALLTAGGFLDGRAFPGELLALFRLQYAAAGLVLAGAALAARQRRTALAAGAVAAASALGLLPALLDDARPDPERPQLRLLVANVWNRNDDHARLVELVRRERPDVVAVTELTPAWQRGLEGRLGDQRARVLVPRADTYGIGLYARVPLERAVAVRPGGRVPDVVRTTAALEGGRLELFLVHAPGVVGRRTVARQREFMRQLAELVREAGPRVLVCGDLNAAPWSRPLRLLASRAGLQRAEAWRPGEWSFPAWGRPLGTPIDQCLAGDGVRVRTRLGERFGSDHLPLLVEVEIDR